jgi:hypothetical protein
MVALQKSLMEQSDIVPVLKGFEMAVSTLADGTKELYVKNPPTQIVAHQGEFVSE